MKDEQGTIPTAGQPDNFQFDPAAFARMNAIIRRVVEETTEPEARRQYLVLVDLGTEQLRLLRDLEIEKAWRENDVAAALTWRASVLLVLREQMAEARADGVSEEEVAEALLCYEEATWASFPRNYKRPTREAMA